MLGTGLKFLSSGSGMPSARASVNEIPTQAIIAITKRNVIPNTPFIICGPVLDELNPSHPHFNYWTLEEMSWAHFKA
jgi:hypothetical protein